MAIPQWVKSSVTDLIALGPSPVLKISRLDKVIRFLHADGTSTDYPYPDFTTAAAVFDDYTAITEAASTGLPQIAVITPADIVQVTLPQNITVTGVAFDPSAVIVLNNYTSGTIVLATVGIPTSTVIVATVPNTVVVGTYDVLYTDTPGNTDLVRAGLVII